MQQAEFPGCAQRMGDNPGARENEAKELREAPLETDWVWANL